jgi:hypothetical protein
MIRCYVHEQWWICATQARTSAWLTRLLRGLPAAIITVVLVPLVLLLLPPLHKGLRCQRISRRLLAPVLLHSCSKHSSGLSCKPSNKLNSKWPTRLCAPPRHSSSSNRLRRYGLRRLRKQQLQQQEQEQLQHQGVASGIDLTSLAAAAATAALMARERRERALRRR